jgi:hypothetical protein
MNRDDIIRMAREDCPYTSDELRGAFFDGYIKGAAAEREECAGVEVTVTVPERGYNDLSPKDIYEEALIDASLAFRAAIRARGQE